VESLHVRSLFEHQDASSLSLQNPGKQNAELNVPGIHKK
jgi:hypothetical protein